jgi:hypothetical protein
MKYYLDTSCLYKLGQIPPNILESCFYSAFSLLEILAGLNEHEWQKRKTVLTNLKFRSVECDYTLPPKFLFDSFDHLKEDEFIEKRIDDLKWIANEVEISQSFSEFMVRQETSKREYGLSYFVNWDNFITTNFIDASERGNIKIALGLKEDIGKKSANYDVPDFGSRREIIEYLSRPGINRSFTVLSMAIEANRIFKKNDISDEKLLYNSYNGNIEAFIEAFSNYSLDQIINSARPSKNDFQDIMHLYYLRSGLDIRIVSDDKIFKRYAPGFTMNLNELLATL